MDRKLQTCLVFAARYSYNRATAASHAVIECIKQNWNKLDLQTKKQLIEESEEATECIYSWEEFKSWANGECNKCGMSYYNCLCSHED